LIGVLFALANAINASLNVVGFCQTVLMAEIMIQEFL
jgi:hypothetical protein